MSWHGQPCVVPGIWSFGVSFFHHQCKKGFPHGSRSKKTAKEIAAPCGQSQGEESYAQAGNGRRSTGRLTAAANDLSSIAWLPRTCGTKAWAGSF